MKGAHAGLKTNRFNPPKKGPTLNLNFSKLGTCQGQHSFTLAYQTIFRNRHFQTCVASPRLPTIEKMVGGNMSHHFGSQ
jgi:hypothetical protein